MFRNFGMLGICQNFFDKPNRFLKKLPNKLGVIMITGVKAIGLHKTRSFFHGL